MADYDYPHITCTPMYFYNFIFDVICSNYKAVSKEREREREKKQERK